MYFPFATSILRTAVFYYQLAFINASRLDFRRSLVSGLPSPNRCNNMARRKRSIDVSKYIFFPFSCKVQT